MKKQQMTLSAVHTGLALSRECLQNGLIAASNRGIGSHQSWSPCHDYSIVRFRLPTTGAAHRDLDLKSLAHFRCAIMDGSNQRVNRGFGGTNQSKSNGQEQFRMPRTYTIDTSIQVLRTDVHSRYFAIIKNLRKQICNFHFEKAAESFSFPAVLVARDVDPSVLEELPTIVKDVRVKCHVRDGHLFIVNISSGPGHGAGVNEINGQALAWAERRFAVISDSVMRLGEGDCRGLVPSCTIQVSSNLEVDNVGRRRSK
jgi:hypothetical protein